MGKETQIGIFSRTWDVFVWILLISATGVNAGTVVTHLQPHVGSLAGANMITILGSGFSMDQFSQNEDPDTGNFVYLVSESGSEFNCPVHMDGSTETQIMCYTPEKMSQDNYYAKLKVDGVIVPDNSICGGDTSGWACKYVPYWTYTPTIETLSPQSGLPGGFVTMTGRLFSDRYGSNLASASNGRPEKLLRVYLGPQDCGLKDGDDFYTLALDNEDSDDGTMMCKTKGTSVGFFNASYIVESPFGRALPDDDVYRVSYNDEIYMYQTYTDITSISPASGSTEGGVTLTIYGNYFDDRAPYTAPRAYIGATECPVTNVVVDEYIECTVAADPQNGQSIHEGNRGITFEYWNSTTKTELNVDEILSLTSGSTGYNLLRLDETNYDDVNDTMDDYVSRMSMFFYPPHTGQYQFILQGDDGAKLFMDNVYVIESTGNWGNSTRKMLHKGTKYLLTVIHYASSGSSFIHLKAKYFDTQFTSAWTGKAEQEIQTIQVTSTVEYDVQELSFSGFANQTYTKEVQTVSVVTPGMFRFGLFGVYTEPLSALSDEATVGVAINSLPVFGSEESITVVRNPSDSGDTASFTFTFESKRGDFPMMDTVNVASEPEVGVTPSQDIRGVPDGDAVSLRVQGRVSPPFTVAALDANSLSTALDTMFSALCPNFFESEPKRKHYESFENDGVSFNGERAKDTEPFCGRYSLKNPHRMFQVDDESAGISLSANKELCFAYKGLLQDSLWIRYSYKLSSAEVTETRTDRYDLMFDKDSDLVSTTWYYKCIDIYALVMTTRANDLDHRVRELWVARVNSDTDVYIDALFIGQDFTTSDTVEINSRRLRPAMPNGALIDTVLVTSSKSDTYTITIQPFQCGNEFPLIELANGQLDSENVASPSTAAAFSLLNGGVGVMHVNRTSFASPPVTGSIDVTFINNTKFGLNVELEAKMIQRELESLVGIGDLTVEKNGDCANFGLRTTFLSLPGDLPEMMVDSTNLAGINAQSSITTNRNGSLRYDPLTGDMLSTVHDAAQVRLYINDVAVACSGDCSFVWDSNVTPTVTAVSPNTGTSSLGTSIVITGTGFNGNTADNTVVIGGVTCAITAATTTSITCDVGNGPVGDHKVMVTVSGKGIARHPSGDVTFTYTADILGISPVTGSLGGGLLLTISGYGFKSAANVTVGGAHCHVTTTQADEIVCELPPASTSGLVDVSIQQGSSVLTYTGYTYNNSLTPTVTSLTPTTIYVTGGAITIDGSLFGVSGRVFIGTQEAMIVTYTDTEVVVNATGLDPGLQPVKLETTDGFALTSSGSLPTIDVDLTILNVYPLVGSLQGGTRLTVTGSGFGTDVTVVDVSVGDTACDVATINDTQIVCQIGDTGTVHYVTNGGTDPAFGVFYAFDKPQITINRGDFVHWSWTTPEFVKNVAHAIIEVEDASSTVAKVGGFSSGPPARNGQFQYQFSQVGTFHVWTDYVDSYGIKNYYGQIEVIDKTSNIAEVQVQVIGKDAPHNIGGAADPVDSSACQAVTAAKSGCTESPPTGGDVSKFNFIFSNCSTPIVDSFDERTGTANTVITVSGEGFSDINCQNEISIGAFECEVTSSTDSSVQCKMAKSGEPQLGVLHPMSVHVGNRGYALLNIMSPANRSFGLIPSLDNIQPTSGSLSGGAILTVTGFGFGDAAVVTVDSYACNILTMSYSEITCETPAGTQGNKDVVVQVSVGGGIQVAECETSSINCRYSYASIWSPVVSAINPVASNGSETFTITGQLLGTDPSVVDINIGGISATVLTANDTHVTASIQNIRAGSNDVLVRVGDYGKASGSLVVTGGAVISNVTPSAGSIHGETSVTILGNGFVAGDTAVTIGGATCNVQSVTLAEVTCMTTAHSDGVVTVVVMSNSITYPSVAYNYSSDATPTVTSVSPVSALPGATLTISGSNLNGGALTVLLGDTPCNVTASNASVILCTIGAHATGMVAVSVRVEGCGVSNSDVQFEYQLQLSSINPTMGGTAGGQVVTFNGTGFADNAIATICGQPCVYVSTTSTKYRCRTPPLSAQTCDVAITVNGLTGNLLSVYTYDGNLTPTISAVTPTRGGTGGGVSLTLTGSGFGSTVSDVSVTIDGVVCVVSTVIDTLIMCVTGPHMGSIQTRVNVEISGNGIAQEATVGDSEFDYIDVWSSPFTWGGLAPPTDGDFVVIPAGMSLLLDTNTSVLSFLLIQGGELIFDERDLELQSKIIMITDGGRLQVGTEAEPFQHKAVITLHGHHRDKELPIYGTKVLAVRNGTLDLHGDPVAITWTRLASTAAKDSNSLVLVDPVEWNVGDEIVIASTGHRHTQSENEKKVITAISGDKRTLTLDSALEASHLGVEETFDGTVVEFRAEVGLLTHNVVVRGNWDPQWEDEISSCPSGFNTGEFATQTCFLGRFGDEIGSSQFGGMILVHAPVYDTHEAQARLSYIEVTFAGQAFRLGRYPVHFHLNGDMSTSYVRGLGIHETFNRAVNIHGTHNTLVEKTVIYNIMGGAFFLEDGIETGNTFQYNLAVFVRESSSLLNDDITPASFWVTNPNNVIQHNAAAGGTHFGYWYRMHSTPDGPSKTPDVCPDNVPLGVFNNNTAHSFGWFGLWVFENYFPLQGGCGGSTVVPAVFRGLTAWNNDKGAEAVNSGALQFENFVLVQNRLAGYEGKKVLNVPLYTDDGPMIRDSLIVGTTTVAPEPTQGCTGGGITLPYGHGFQAKNIRFVNFEDDTCSTFRWTRITGTCSLFCGGYPYHTEGISFINAPNKAHYEWDWEGILIDQDGSLTGSSGWSVLPTTGSLPDDCVPAPEFSKNNAASMCPPQHKFHRFAFNNIVPASLEGKNFLITNQYGTSSVPFAKKRLSHKPGWMMALVDGATYTFEFENGDQIKNISYTGAFYDFAPTDYIIIKLAVFEFPDRFSIDGGDTFINATVGGLNASTAMNGDWEWDNSNSEIHFLVHGTKRSKRSMSIYEVDRPFSQTLYKCYYKDCIPPPDPDTVPPANERPALFAYWNDTTLWNMSTDGYVENADGSYGIPQDYDNVRILADEWVVVNSTINKLGTLIVSGVLEFANHESADYEINADFIIILGGRLIIGWPDSPFLGQASIVLRGNHSSPTFILGDGPTIGSKALGVFGGLDLFGKDVGVAWTNLATTAMAGTNQITLKENVSWVAGDEIVIGPTSFSAWQTETFALSVVSSDGLTLTLNESLKFNHIAHNETLPSGAVIDVGAAVGLLTRNIKIIGESYPDLFEESFGARILVGLLTIGTQTYTGYARLSNVEFYHTGQEGWTEEYDARFSVAYIATGTVTNVKPSAVMKCAFHHGFSTAVGAFGIGSLDITDNVVHHSVGNALRTSSNDTRLINNMVVLIIWTGTYQERFETFNPRWEAGIEAMEATSLILQDNLVTGSERIGYHVAPQSCDDTSDDYKNNKAFANLEGVVVFPEDKIQVDCAKVSGFTAWKSHDFGIYYQNTPGAVLSDNIIVDNQIGMFTLIVGPSSVGHQVGNKTVEVIDSVFVGATSSFDCTNDVTPFDDDNFALSGQARPGLAPSGGMIGLLFPNFNQGPNKAPEKPWQGCMAYNSIAGLMKISGLTFAHYGNSQCNGDFAVASNVGNDDGQHPIESQNITFHDVDTNNKIVYHRPNVGKINSADCVDMDCDALKKTLFKDLDGTFLGHVGAVIPMSEFEWDSDTTEGLKRGIGYYRVPKEMVTDLDGTRIPYETMMPNKGIIRTSQCTLRPTWQAYECHADINYEMLMIESMDEDTETRRLSPVAILGDGYIDLINGPQDHGWCSGYTCRKRVSLFMGLVATGEEYLLHFTSTTPKHMRYMLLNVDPDEAIKLTVWYSRPNRLDVYVDGSYEMATNGRTNSNGQYIIDMPKGNEYEPQLANVTGTNFYHKDRGEITIIIKGPSLIEVKTSETIIVSFSIPALTVDDFYGESMVENIAAFLNIPLTKVRVVNVVSAAATSGRRRRSTDGIVVELEIGDEPSATSNSTVADSIDTSELLMIASDIIAECQAGDVSSSFNVSGGCESVEVPSSDPEVGSITYETPTPDHLIIVDNPAAQYEGVLLDTQPKLRAVELSNVVVEVLGTSEYPWELTASIQPGTGHLSATLSGTLTVNVSSDGWFNFTDLSISHMADNYILDFNVTSPATATNFSTSSDPFNVSARPLTTMVVSMTSGDIVQYSQFSMTLDLEDSITGDVIADIAWRDHTWTAEASILGNSQYGSLTGVVTSTFDPMSGEALFPDLNVTGFGLFYIQFMVTSTPTEFNFTHNHKLNVLNPSQVGWVPAETYEIQVKFNVDYNTVVSTTEKQNEFEQMIMQEYANLWPDVRIQSSSIAEGSIVVTFVIDGSVSNVNATAYAMCDSITNSTQYSFGSQTLTLSSYMTINNNSFYGVTCGSTESAEPEKTGLSVLLIVLISVIAAAVVVAIVILVIWRCSVKPKTQTHGVHGTYMGSNIACTTKSPEDYMFRDNTFTSMMFRPGATSPIPPTNVTAAAQYDEYLSSTTKRRLSANSETVVSPTNTFVSVARLMGENNKEGKGATDEQRHKEPNSKAMFLYPRNPSPATLSHNSGGSVSPARSTSPRLSRSHSPFPEYEVGLYPGRENSMPPVGESLYRSGYITTPMVRSPTPVLPAENQSDFT